MVLRLLMLSLPLAGAVLAEEQGVWPRSFKAPAAKVVRTDAPEGVAFAYETAHFRLHADRELKPLHLEAFATVIESVPLLLESLPLPVWAPPEGDKPRIVLHHDSLDYHSAGGPIGSTGFYDGRRQRIIIRADVFLSPPPAKPTRLRPKPNEDLLVHELTHLGMHGILGKMRPWLYEGLAEYLAAAHTGQGSYNFSRMDQSIRDHVRPYLPANPDNSFSLPSLKTLMTTDGKQWLETSRRTDNALVYRPYAASLLLVHYHLHGKERRKLLDRHLRQLHAHRDRRLPLPRLATEPAAAIEDRLTKYWQPKGLTLRFENP